MASTSLSGTSLIIIDRRQITDHWSLTISNDISGHDAGQFSIWCWSSLTWWFQILVSNSSFKWNSNFKSTLSNLSGLQVVRPGIPYHQKRNFASNASASLSSRAPHVAEGVARANAAILAFKTRTLKTIQNTPLKGPGSFFWDSHTFFLAILFLNDVVLSASDSQHFRSWFSAK